MDGIELEEDSDDILLIDSGCIFEHVIDIFEEEENSDCWIWKDDVLDKLINEEFDKIADGFEEEGNTDSWIWKDDGLDGIVLEEVSDDFL